MKLKVKNKNNKIFFDSDLYLKLQIRAIKERARSNKAKRVYIEFGGKIFDDFHASRVLPGYPPDMKLQIIQKLFKQADIIFVVSAKDIIRSRIRGDHKITYDIEVFRLLPALESNGILIKNIVITRMPNECSIPLIIKNFIKKLKQQNKIVKLLKEDLDHINPKKDWLNYHNNDFVSVKKKYVIIMSPGGGSGKFGVCMNQLYHEMKNGVIPFYIKFETFPVHDLSVLHPLNLAYMAASADFYDLVMKDPRNQNASSYNRDVENYEILHHLARHFNDKGIFLKKITSATNMGVNILSKAILDLENIEKESMAEIGRRLIRHKYEVERGEEKPEVLERIRKIVALV